MTKVVFKKENGFWSRLEINGHANYANFGQDIVCAAISTAAIMSINLLERIISNRFEVFQNDQKGYICLENICYDDIDKEKVIFIHQIFENLKDTLLEIQMKYPKNLHVKIENNE